MKGKMWTLSASPTKEINVRKFNAVLSIAILALFLLHAAVGLLQLSGLASGGNVLLKTGAWVMLAAVAVHAVIGTVLTVETLKTVKKSGTGHFRENKLFWVRRISGFALMFFLVSHVFVFSGKGGEAFRLNEFDIPQLVCSLLLVISLLVHVVSNMRPLMLALGAGKAREFVGDLAFVLSVLLLAAGAAFVIYYFRWIM